MQIGELSRRTGLSRDTIRWYEKIGLIVLDKKLRGENNYRNYTQDIEDRLISIKQSKSLGFTLKEIEELIFLEESDSLNCSTVSKIVEIRLKSIDKKIADLRSLKSRLQKATDSCSGNCKETLSMVE